ncbi:hypothetical protein [Spirosoma panaciterrae]|uniref:hypothetical protein n=1 Tax=Spirosoma panaciterrae TaxID=496058 RepID=UPI000376FBA2|nr:hypothetical protein [Spirosoma panaciterrae]
MATKFILAAIDGTGSRKWRRPDGTNSHVYCFYRDIATNVQEHYRPNNPPVEADSYGNAKAYWHGPGNLGLEDRQVVIRVVNYVRQMYDRLASQSPGTDEIKVCIVGHSRGGHIGIQATKALYRLGIEIYFLGLYDAVDMDMVIGGDRAVPIRHDNLTTLQNAEHVVHATRHPEFRSRYFWANSRVRGEIHRSFITSHGGIGGDFSQVFDGFSAFNFINSDGNSPFIIDDQSNFPKVQWYRLKRQQGNLPPLSPPQMVGLYRYLELITDPGLSRYHLDSFRIGSRTFNFNDIPSLVSRESRMADNFIRGKAKELHIDGIERRFGR